MGYIAIQRQKIFNNIMLGFILFMFFPIVYRLFYPSSSGIMIYVNLGILLFCSLLYYLNKKMDKTSLLTHIFLISFFILTIVISYKEANQGLFIIFIFVTPMFAYILLAPKLGSLYAVLALVAVGLLTSFLPGQLTLDNIMRIFILGLLMISVLHGLAYTRERALEEIQDYMNNMEDKVKKALAQEKEQKKLLIQTSKLASLGEMLANVSHQWKQPLSSLSAINMNLQVQEEFSETPNEDRQALIKQMQEQIDFMSNTMQNFRSFFKTREDKNLFSLSSSSHQLIDLFEKDFKSHGIKIDYIEASKDAQAFAYENMYQQVLLNIITNAKEAIEEHNAQDKRISIVFAHTEDYAIVEIEDYAGGVPAEIIDQIFEKQFTTKGEKGSGIGLAMSKEIIQDFCQGRIKAVNTQNGFKISISLPLK